MNEVMNSLENVCVSRLCCESKPLPNLKPVHRQHLILSFPVDCTCEIQARRKRTGNKTDNFNA